MNAMGRDYSSQLSEKTRELSEKREEVRRLTERMNAMERDYSSQLSEKTRELTLKEEEITRLTEQSRGSEHLDQANNLQQRDRDWVINRNEVQIRRDQNLGKERGELFIVGNFVDVMSLLKKRTRIFCLIVICNRSCEMLKWLRDAAILACCNLLVRQLMKDHW